MKYYYKNLITLIIIMNIIKKIKQLRISFYIFFFKLFPIQKNKIIFFTSNLNKYDCNPKYLSEYLNNWKDLDIVWVFENTN